MAFSVLELRPLDDGSCHAVLEHYGQPLTALLKCSYPEAAGLPPGFLAEIDYSSLVRFETGGPADDRSAGLFSTDDPSVILADGTVHNLVEIGSGQFLIDICIQQGPEFLTVTSGELGGSIPTVDTRLRAWLLGFSVHPTRT